MLKIDKSLIVFFSNKIWQYNIMWCGFVWMTNDASLKQGLRTQGNNSDFNCNVTLAVIYILLPILT